MPTHKLVKRRNLSINHLRGSIRLVRPNGPHDLADVSEITTLIERYFHESVIRVMSTMTSTANVLTIGENRPKIFDRQDNNHHTIVLSTICLVVSLVQLMKGQRRALMFRVLSQLSLDRA